MMTGSSAPTGRGLGSTTTSPFGGGRVTVSVEPAFLPGESRPAENGRDPLYLFIYEVTVSNEPDSTKAVQLATRHWVIVDADGDRRDVRGPGVVGRQPRLQPGESFSYHSSCPLTTPWGTMEGSYGMVCDDGERFDAVIDRFYLVADRTPAPAESGSEA